MNEDMTTDVDPLSTYCLSYPPLDNYTQLPLDYQNPVKQENFLNYNFYTASPIEQAPPVNNDLNLVDNTSDKQTNVVNNEANITNNTPLVDFNPCLPTRRRKIKKEKSAYFSEKIMDKDFPFYGCAACNICFKTLQELDSHVSVHKDRITSYDLRIKNQIKKRKLQKELKKNKKAKKNVKQEMSIEIEIKPEEGYIGNEKASDVVSTESDNQSLKENNGNGECSNNKNVNNKDKDSDKVNKNDNSGDVTTKKQERVNLQKIYKCFACQKQFMLSYYLKLHVRSHTDEKPYTCAQCGQAFITASKLGRHNKRYHLAIRHQCRICYRFFSRFEFLTRHFDKKHPDDKLEGEPYDYNAILPYLKELEAELKEKAESEKAKAKIEELWTEELPIDKKDYIKEEMPIEEVKVHMDVEIKFEAEEEVKEEGGRSVGEEAGSDKEEVKDENSDSDYFPSSTWAAPPAEAPGLRCEACGKTVSSRSYMRIHMRTHTGERPYKCYICGTGFITSSKMHRHVLTHPESWDEDGVKPESKSKGEKEIKSETERDDAYDVNDKKKVKMKAGLAKFAKKPRNKEQKRVYQKRPHACEFCQKRFLHLETLQVHKKSHSGEEVVHACHYCLLELPDAEARVEHERGHTGAEAGAGARPYLCTLCGNTYQKRESMMYHRKSHTHPKSFRCVSCPASFSAACKLSRHARSHAPAAYSLRYECPVCAHVFNTHYHARMHLATHQREGLIQENNRNEILAMVLQNARKIPKTPHAAASELIPPDERSRVCNICGEVFQHFYFLEEHLKSHGTKIAIEDSEKEEEKKHICSVCNKGFKLHYYLKLHSFTHTKEKPFICQQCGKGFITRGKLKRHLETHTGLKKYQCHICYKFFTRPSYLRIHVRTIHGTQDYNFRLEKQYGLSSLPVMGNEHL